MDINNIKSFSIYGLFGTDNVHIPFNENVKILIGENGLGKTQVLNLFYYTLTKNFSRLNEFSFDKVELELKDEKITISKEEIIEMSNFLLPSHPIIKEIIDKIGINQFNRLRNDITERSPSTFRMLINKNPSYRRLREIYPTDIIYDLIKESIYESEYSTNQRKKKNSQNLFTANIQKCSDIIDKNLSKNLILYFPTYRRVEEDLHNLGYDDEELFSEENTLIQFGMDDVQRRFSQIENTIDRLIKDGFSKFSSELINQFFKDDETQSDLNDEDYLKNIDENDIEILLSRVGDRIPSSKREKIKEIVLSKQLENSDSQLNLLLKKLIENYSPQKELDNSVKEFRDVCNNYLVNKKVFYDESAIKINIKSERNNSEIDLSKLSSGEKQIISMFSKIYLSERHKRFIVLFDEPELSLSMKWQRQLLPDIVKSKKCDFLLAVTHSPFIFENELDNFAIGLNEYIKPIKNTQKLNGRSRTKAS